MLEQVTCSGCRTCISPSIVELQYLYIPAPRRSEGHENTLVLANSLIKVLVAQVQYIRWDLSSLLSLGASILCDVVLETFQIPAASIVYWVCARAWEVFDCWKAADAVFGAQFLVLIAVDFCNGDL